MDILGVLTPREMSHLSTGLEAYLSEIEGAYEVEPSVSTLLEDIFNTPNEWEMDALPPPLLAWAYGHDSRAFLVLVALSVVEGGYGMDAGYTYETSNDLARHLIPILRRLARAAGCEVASSSGP